MPSQPWRGRIRQVEEGNWMQLDTVKQWKVVDIITKLLGLKNATFESANPTTAKLTNLQSLPFHFTFAHPVLEHCAVCHTGALCSADRMHPGLKGTVTDRIMEKNKTFQYIYRRRLSMIEKLRTFSFSIIIVSIFFFSIILSVTACPSIRNLIAF